MSGLRISRRFLKEMAKDFGYSVPEDKAIIKISFKSKDGFEITHNFSNKEQFEDIRHLGNYIRKMIRNKYEKEGIDYEAVCTVNPWNKELKVDRHNVSFEGQYKKSYFLKPSDNDIEQGYEYTPGDPASDRHENPWLDIFGPGDDAETAYWNTD